VILSSLVLLTMVIGSGCARDSLLGPSNESTGPSFFGPPADGETPPTGLATVALGPESLSLWPYTGSSFDGSPVDPINLIFAGEVDPLQIRAALMALDGDRSEFNIPPIPPFNARWTDLVGGGVQTAYAEGPLGWSGSVIQLTLGDFGPIRVHLRLFRTRHAYGESGTWTLGGAHFELQIPGTAEHQVLSWELAEQIVVADLIRSGLLDSTVPMQPSGLISDAPTYRTIPAVIYNGIPAPLVGLIGGPSQPVTEDVPIPSDGSATILNVAGSVPIESGSWSRSAAVAFGQVVPKPFCVTGPGDFLMVTGPVDFVTDVTVNANGRYTYHSSYAGHLEATPVDMSSGAPVPIGDPQVVRVAGRQTGFLDESGGRIAARDRRLVRSGDGPELWNSRLVVPEHGRKTHSVHEQCLDSTE
jgi:hypothetical protein